MKCNLCPHQCNIDRAVRQGRCHSSHNVQIAHVGVHHWEEPIVSGELGSGTIFLAGCNLSCRYCQNHSISQHYSGVELSVPQLADILLRVQDMGVHNINLVTPSHYSSNIAKALALVKHRLAVPVVYNTNSYELVESLEALDGLVDVYLPDLKYFDSSLSLQLSGVADYFAVASRAIEHMKSVQPLDVVRDGIIKKGVIVRHMVLPNHRQDSKDVLAYIATLGVDTIVSLMSQYTPTHIDAVYAYLNNKVTPRQYDNVVDYAYAVGLHNIFTQDISSACEGYVPHFDTDTVTKLLGAKYD